MSDINKDKSFFEDLWDRRFFQFLGTYLAVSWGLIQFVSFGSLRDWWESNLVERFTILLLLLLPGMAIYIYNHGRKGDDAWRPYEKWLLPLNLVLALGVAFGISVSNTSKKEELKSETVTITTDEGNLITREIPNIQMANRLVVFPLNNESRNSEVDWMKFGIGMLLTEDVEQDMRITAIDPSSLSNSYDEYNKELKQDINEGTRMRIAKDRYTDYYIDGSFNKSKDLLNVTINLKKSENGSLVYSNEYQGSDIYDVVDQIAVEINEKLYSKEFFGTNEIVDLPAKSLLTSNVESLQKFVEGVLTAGKINNGDYLDSETLLKDALEIDEECGMCYTILAQLYSGTNRNEDAKEIMRIGMMHSSGLSERSQLYMKWMNYSVNMNPRKAIDLLEMWRQLYPMDSQPYLFLMRQYSLTLNKNKAKQVGIDAIENGHSGLFLRRVAGLCIDTGDLDKAEEYLELFNKEFPEKAKENTQLGDIYIKQGKLTEAKKFFEKLNLLDPDKHGLLLRISEVNDKLCLVDESKKAIDEAYAVANTMNDTLSILDWERKHYLRLGKAEKALDKFKERVRLSRKVMPSFVVDAQVFLQGSAEYFFANRIEEFRDSVKVKFAGDTQQLVFMSALGEHIVNSVLEDTAQYWKSYLKVKPLMLQSIGQSYDKFAQGFRFMIEGDYEKAINFLEEYSAETETGMDILGTHLLDCYLRNGQADKAIELCDEMLLTDGCNPIVKLKKAKALNDIGKRKKSKTILTEVLDFYKKADPNYKHLIEAQALQKQLNGE